MSSRKVLISEEAALELQEIVESRSEFDRPSALKSSHEIFERLQRAADNPRMFEYAGRRFGIELRRFPHKGCVIVYGIFEDRLAVVHVFGPGQNWQEKL